MITKALFVLLGITFAFHAHAAQEIDHDQIEAEAMDVLDRFMATFNSRDPAGHAATYQFPHFRLARGVMNSWPTQADATSAHEIVFQALPDTGWTRSEWVHRKIVTLSASKVHVDTRFRRLREDGSVIGVYDSLYVLTKANGRWGVKMRSSFL
jgi:hypothetical protein